MLYAVIRKEKSQSARDLRDGINTGAIRDVRKSTILCEDDLCRIITKTHVKTLYNRRFDAKGWTPDGKKLVLSYRINPEETTSGETILTCDLKGNIEIMEEHTGPVADLAVSPDGNKIAYVSSGFTEGIHTHNWINIIHRKKVQKLTRDGGNCSIRWSPDSSMFGVHENIIDYGKLTRQGLLGEATPKNRFHLVGLDGTIKTYDVPFIGSDFLSPKEVVFGAMTYSFIRGGGKLIRFDLESEEYRVIKKDGGSPCIRVSSTKDLISKYDGGELKIIDTSGNVPYLQPVVYGFSWSPDTTDLVFMPIKYTRSNRPTIEMHNLDYSRTKYSIYMDNLKMHNSDQRTYKAKIMLQPEVKD